MRINNMRQLRRRDRSRIRKIENNYYLLSGNECYQVNEIGALIVNAVGKDITIDAVCEKLSIMYNNPDIAGVRMDVDTFINFIIEKGIVSEDILNA